MDKDAASGRSNRRLTARHACHLNVRYRTDGQWHPAMAMDLSHRGCRLRLGEDLSRGASVAVVFEKPGAEGVPSQAVELTGRVIWTRLEGLSYQAGILFLSEPDALHDILAGLP